MRTCTAFVAVLALLVSACAGDAPSDERREYKLQGQILSVSADRKEAIIKHEDIPGFMTAMTMPYHGKDASTFENLAAGDLINATLVVETRDAYVQAIKKVGEAPLERAAGSASPGAIELLASGQPVPAVKLIDQDGKAFGIDAFHGSAVIVSFTYSTCPMPDMCPLIDKQFVAIQQKLQAQHNEIRARLLTVSIDPSHDTPAVLKAYGARLGVDPTIWTLATGSTTDIDPWASKFGVSVSRAANDPTDITHNLRTVIFDRQGNLVQSYSGTSWTADQVLADVRVMVGID